MNRKLTGVVVCAFGSTHALRADEHAVIGRGFYGKVVRPSLPCSDGRQLCPPGRACVSKVFFWQDNVELEHERYAAVTRTDPHGKFSPRVYGKCDSHIVMDDVGDVPLLPKFKDHVNALSFRKLLVAALPLFDAVAHLEVHGLVHNDIHQRNIVLKLPDGPMRLVDFGQCMPHPISESNVVALGDTLMSVLDAWTKGSRLNGSESLWILQPYHETFLRNLKVLCAAKDLFRRMKQSQLSAFDARAEFLEIIKTVF